ncbi:hypothetical protein EVA_14325 [gut metagenome]|uniref:Uncharacterized protein n=1 Tax=gut metagenome TaxID=749906 RepID=J9FSW1_9ZZZZ
MLKDTKSLGNNKAPACESRGFVRKKKEVRILTHLLILFHHLIDESMQDYTAVIGRVLGLYTSVNWIKRYINKRVLP